MRLRGRIDRVDTYEEGDTVYVKVVDYKSGNKKFDLVSLYYGLQLQLAVYLNAAMEVEKKKKPDKKIVPAALLYYHIADPMIMPDRELTDREIEEQILAKLKMNGVVNEEEKVVRLLDQTFETKSDIIPVERKKDGSFSARSSVMSREELETISDYVNQKIGWIGTRILQGDMALNPYEKGAESACAYCAYKSVCGFDGRIAGYRKRKLETMTKDEVMDKIAKETGQDPE